MYYYTVAAIQSTDVPRIYRLKGITTIFVPDVPEGTIYVGSLCADGTFLIATAELIPNLDPIPESELENVCNEKGVSYENALTWYVSG